MEAFCELFDGFGTFVDKGLQALELEVPDFFGGLDGELVDEGSDEGSAVVGVPMVGEGSVIFLFVVALPLGVFLHEPEQDAGGPLLGVEVVELFGFTGLDVFGVGVEVGVGGSDDVMEEGHPGAGNLFDFGADFVVHCFPEELDAEVDVFGVTFLLEQILQGR